MRICNMALAMHLMRPLPSLLSILAIATVSFGSDEAALLAFKAELSDQHSAALATWNSSTSFCYWEGVTCNRLRNPPRVVALNLSSRGLTGTLSPAIGNLTFLRTLNLSFNWLHGDIPASIGRLRRLHSLDMWDNLISGALPANLSSCTNMMVLDVSDNQIHGQIPAEIGNTLTRLRVLWLKNNSFTGPIPASLANLSFLHNLHLSGNQLEGLIPPGLGNMQDLSFFSLSDNHLSGVLPHSLYNLSSLMTFDVGLNMLHGSIPADIGDKFPNIQYFGMYGNRFIGHIPSSLTNLSTITELYLSGNRFTGFVPRNLGRQQDLMYLYLNINHLEADNREGWEFISSLANCTQLLELVISDNSFRGQLPDSMVNLSTTLQMLYIGVNRISGSIPSDISNLVGLNLLTMDNTFLSGVIPESIGKLANLVELLLHNSSFSGLIPSSIGNLTGLARLAADYNNLEGPIPASLGKLKKLNVLGLSNNYRLNGSIPKEILELTSLSHYLDLSYNSLSGPLPSEVGSLANLNLLILSGNQLSGQIPDTIGNCIVLQTLYLDTNSFEGSIPQSMKNMKGLNVLNLTMNKLSGTIPDTVGSIGNLQELYLAHNNLSGVIPASLQNLSSLLKLDVSFNNLQGRVPTGGIFKNSTYLSVAGNSKLCGGIPQLHLVPCSMGPSSKNSKQWSKSLIKVIATTGAIILLVLVVVLMWLLYKKLKQRQNAQGPPSIIEEQYKKVSYQTLSRGTDRFSEANLLGKGRYGVVYKCTLDNEGMTVAVKVFNLQQSGSSKSFEAECEALRRVRHRCLLKIITCCSSINSQGQEFKALVFEFMPNGSLDDWLHPKYAKPTPRNTLSLAQRLRIAVDIMDAMDYLHNYCQPPIIHCDLKPSNILLAEDMSARVGDFGISRIVPENTNKTLPNSNSSIGIRGTIGYVAPEYGEGCAVSPLGDVHSLGILLLEMFTGKSPTDDMFTDSLDLHKLAEVALPDRVMEIADPTIWLHKEASDTEVADANITRAGVQECLVSAIGLGISCSNQQPRQRMLMRDAAVEMHAIRDAYLMF